MPKASCCIVSYIKYPSSSNDFISHHALQKRVMNALVHAMIRVRAPFLTVLKTQLHPLDTRAPISDLQLKLLYGWIQQWNGMQRALI